MSNKAISSCECNKIVTDILAKFKYLLIWKIQSKSHNSKFSPTLKTKKFHVYKRNKPPKTIKKKKKQKKLELKTASPAKRPNCRYDFVATRCDWSFYKLSILVVKPTTCEKMKTP